MNGRTFSVAMLLSCLSDDGKAAVDSRARLRLTCGSKIDVKVN